jgi:hypothetical protein
MIGLRDMAGITLGFLSALEDIRQSEVGQTRIKERRKRGRGERRAKRKTTI